MTAVKPITDPLEQQTDPPLESDTPIENAPAHEQPAGDGSLKKRAVSGSKWTAAQYIISQVLRLASNIIMAQILAPEDFGLVVIVTVVITGLYMLSDLGTGPAIVQSARGEDPTFYNTAWTVNVIRGLCIAGIVALLAHPIAIHYGSPMLSGLLLVAALGPFISAFTSTAISVLYRRMDYAKITILELASQIVGIAVMIGTGLITRSVWALVVGAPVSAILLVVASHIVVKGHHNRLSFDRAAFSELWRYSKWIFLSTAVWFLASNGDRIGLSNLIDEATLGVYYFAFMLSEAFAKLVETLAGRVGFPAISEIARREPHRLSEIYYRIRLPLDAIGMTAAGGLVIAGAAVVNLLYNTEYAAAGWMLQILGIRVALTCLSATATQCMLAVGQSKQTFTSNLARTVWLLSGIILGFAYFGVPGAVWAIATSEVAAICVLWIALAKRNLLRPVLELRSIAFLAIGAGAGVVAIPILSHLATLVGRA